MTVICETLYEVYKTYVFVHTLIKSLDKRAVLCSHLIQPPVYL
jgi:hypothetical protein